MSLPAVYDLNSVLEILPLSRNRIYQLLESGELHGTKCGNKWLITETAIATFLGLSETDNGTEPESGAAGESDTTLLLVREEVSS